MHLLTLLKPRCRNPSLQASVYLLVTFDHVKRCGVAVVETCKTSGPGVSLGQCLDVCGGPGRNVFSGFEWSIQSDPIRTRLLRICTETTDIDLRDAVI